MIFRLLNYVLHKCIGVSIRNAKEAKCEHCGTLMVKKEKSYLFLLPIFHDDEYEVSASYYLSYCRPINGIEDIPVGQRACKMEILDCPQCQQCDVQVEDFLQVREHHLLKVLARYDFRDFYLFFQNDCSRQKVDIDKETADQQERSMTKKHLSDF